MSRTAWCCHLPGGLLAGLLTLWGSAAVAQDPIALPPAAPAPAPAATATAEEGQVRNGFALGLSFVLHPAFGVSGAGGLVNATALGGGLRLGYKLDRILVYLGFEYGVLSSSAGMTSTDNSSFTIAPGVQVAFLRSANKRAELLGGFQIGGGAIINSQSTGTNSTSTTTGLLIYELTPGARYWVSPNFAIQATVGFGGEVAFGSNGSGTIGAHGLSASAGLQTAF